MAAVPPKQAAATRPSPPQRASSSGPLVFSALLLVFGLQSPDPTQGSAQENEHEVVANLAAGRVIIYVARDGIVVSAVEQRVEANSRPPAVVPLGTRRIGILFGAVEWHDPSSGRAPIRLDRDLAHLAPEATRPRPAPNPDQASDIEAIGVTFLERVREGASLLHRKLDLPPDEPLVELLLVDYEEGYGPEVWLLQYRAAQDVLRGEYRRTRVLRPSYAQLYPPEKDQPRTLIEMHYPPANTEPSLGELIKQNEPRLARLRSEDPHLARAADQAARGETFKASADDATAFLRAALPAIMGVEARLVLGVLYENKGLQWVIPPPEPLQKADEGKAREPGAPTLRKPL